MSGLSDADIRERHGVSVASATQYAGVNEGEVNMRLVIFDSGTSKSVILSPDEARYLAAKLRRVAWRVERRL